MTKDEIIYINELGNAISMIFDFIINAYSTLDNDKPYKLTKKTNRRNTK